MQDCLHNFYVPKFFRAEELVSRETFRLLGAHRVFRYIDSRVLMMADKLAAKFNFDDDGKRIGTTTINNWLWNGNRQYSGLRMPGEPHFKPFSDHTYGRALDMVFSSVTAVQVRDYIEDNPDEFPFITFVEEGENITWLHISTMNLAGMGYTLKNPNSIVFWDFDTRSSREIPRKSVRRLG